eukprot:Anaeramoba_ignava/c20640_g1_i1.p1 GENE.c20640_g1_i1~~c20640_g1_i1.p1  ORF type:complete len:315 (-),score=81.15 c20640_g1_i1:290-1234(-)
MKNNYLVIVTFPMIKIYGKKKKPTIEDMEAMEKECKNLFESLMDGIFSQHKVLIALDQWNVLYDSDRDKTHILEFFHYFASVKNGLFYTAVSSTFSPTGKMSDNDYPEFISEVPIFNSDELQTMMEFEIKMNNLPKEIQISEVKEFTNNVPRMFFYFYQSYSQREIHPGWKVKAEEQAVMYYKQRIFHILNKSLQLTQIPENKKKKIENSGFPLFPKDTIFSEDTNNNILFASNVYLNKSFTDLPDYWKSGGIFIKNDGRTYNFICKWARQAFFNTFKLGIQTFLQVLASLKDTKPFAFENFVSATLMDQEGAF